jgi:predicted choloylglycine hydrolase
VFGYLGGMLKRFVFAREDQPDASWLDRFAVGRDEAERWYLGVGRTTAPTAAECRAALRQHMPELMPLYDQACGMVGDDDRAHQLLSHYRPAPIICGCSQAVWLGSGGLALVRNYDFSLDVVTERFESTSWFGREVVSKAQRPWGGCLDGMNEDGLVASMTFGGSPAQGRGFAIILMLRYVLETCCHVSDAIAALSRIPIAQSHNVTLLDRTGAFATLFLGPDRAPTVTTILFCANHQEEVLWPENAAMSQTIERYEVLARHLAHPGLTLDRLVEHFFSPPLYSRRSGFPTVYTAVYWPIEGRVDYLWPGKSVSQRIGNFQPDEYTHDYGELAQ